MFLELILRMILSFILLIVWYKNFCWKLVLVFGRMCLWMKRDFCIDMEKILEVGKFVFFDFLINFYFWVIKFSIDFILMFLCYWNFIGMLLCMFGIIFGSMGMVIMFIFWLIMIIR